MKKMILAAIAMVALSTTAMAQNSNFNYSVDRFADIEVLRYEVPGFEDLTLKQKELVYYLTEAALNGRDILFDQNGKYNLMVRQTLEEIYRNYNGNKDDKNYQAFLKYLKQVWFGNGIHHHYSMTSSLQHCPVPRSASMRKKCLTASCLTPLSWPSVSTKPTAKT